MEKEVKSNGKLGEMDLSSFALLRRNCPEFLSAFAKRNEVKRDGDSNGARAVGDAVDESGAAERGLPLRRAVPALPVKKWRRDAPNTNEEARSGNVSNGSRRSSQKSADSLEGHRLLREVLAGGKADDRSIPEEVIASFHLDSPDGRAFFQFLQQWTCVHMSHDCHDGCGEETGSASGAPSSISTTGKPSSSANGTGGAWPGARAPGRDLQSHFTSMLSGGLSCDADGDDNDKSGGTGGAQVPSANVDPAAPHSREGFIELLHHIMAKDRWTDEEEDWDGVNWGESNENVDDIDDDVDEVDDNDGDHDEGTQGYYDEDRDDMKDTIAKIDGLSLHTMRELASWWNVQPEKTGNEVQYRVLIRDQLRLLAVTIVAEVAARLEPPSHTAGTAIPGTRSSSNRNNRNKANGKLQLPMVGGGTVNGIPSGLSQSDDEPDKGVGTLFYSLRHDICMLSPENLRHFASIFGLANRCYLPEDVFMAISSLGVMTFFAPLPVPLLEKVCHELSIPPGDDAAAITTGGAANAEVDANQMRELLAERISKYFYPMRHALPSTAKLAFMPQMQIHEHAKGRYTCTVDNADLMRVLSLQRLMSNRFICNKIRWHAVLTVINDDLSFYVWHRHSDVLCVRMVIRTQDPKKKRRHNNNNNDAGENGQPAEVTLKESSALFLEKETEAAPGALIGFENFVSLSVALRSSTMSQSGYRLYNPPEDRIVFQYAMDLTNPDGTLLADDGKKKTATPNSNGNKQLNAANQSQQPSANLTSGNASNSDPCIASGKGQGVDGAAADSLTERRRREFEKAAQRLERVETREREVVEQAWSTARRQLAIEHAKSHQKALQRKKDRERKALLAKAGPSPELQRELEAITQTVSTNRAQVAKLAKDKVKEEEAVQRFKEQIEEGSRELEHLRQRLQTNVEVLSKIESEIELSRERTRTKKEAHRRRDPFVWSLPTATRHETLAINDIRSFVSAPPGGDGGVTASPLSSPRHSPIPDSRVSGDIASASANNPNTTSGQIHAQAHTNPVLQATAFGAPAFSPPLAPASPPLMHAGGRTDIPVETLVHLSNTLELVRRTGDSYMNENGDDGLRSLGMMSGGGFTVTEALPHFMFDANAQPFTPTSMVKGTATSVTPQSMYGGGATTASQRTPLSSASPMANMNAFPEKPRYTQMTMLAPGNGNGNGNNSGGGGGGVTPQVSGGLFSTDPQHSFSGFSPGRTSGLAPLQQSRNISTQLNFTTAPWKSE